MVWKWVNIEYGEFFSCNFLKEKKEETFILKCEV